MSKFNMIQAVAGWVAALALAGPAAATAGDCGAPRCTYKKVTCYETVRTYEARREAYQKEFTLYDDCGRPYTVVRTCYRDVQVPVTRQVAVTKWVKVCD